MGLCAALGVRRIPRADRRRHRRCATTPKASTISAPKSTGCRKKLGRRLKFLVGKPGLDGHSNGAEQIAARARDAGMDVVYDGIRLTAEAIAAAAAEKDVHVVGLSILSGSHLPLVRDVVARMNEAGLDDVPVVVGGIIPQEDAGPEKRRRRRGLYAEGFRAQPHHVRPRAHRRKHGGEGVTTIPQLAPMSPPILAHCP